MRKFYYIISFAVVAALTSCENDDTDFSHIIDGSEFEVKNIEFDFAPLDEGLEIIPSDDNDYVENSDFQYIVEVDYQGATATVSGDVNMVTAFVEGAHVTINSYRRNIEYVIKGSSDNGSFKIYSDYKMKITLDGVTLCNPSGAAINNQCGKSLYLVLAPGTENTLCDGSHYIISGNEDMKGAFFSEGQIIFSGSGTLDVKGQYKNAIASDDYIVFRPGNVINAVSTTGHGIKANDGVKIMGGVLNVEVTAAAAKGINSEYDVIVRGGRTTIMTSGNPRVENNDTSSSAAVKCDGSFMMTAGTLNLKSTGEGGKGINVDENISVTSGEINVVTLGSKGVTSPKGIKADGDIAFGKAAIYVYSKASSAIDAFGSFTFDPTYTSLIDKKRFFEVKY